MSEDPSDRRKRLKALRAKASKGGDADSGGGGASVVKFRNYRPLDDGLKEAGPANPAAVAREPPGDAPADKEGGDAAGVVTAGAERGDGDTGTIIQQELQKQKEALDEEVLNLAPKKPNWDLKRDVEKKLARLNRRTQRAIVEIIREKFAAEKAAAGDSGSSSSGEEEEGSGSEEEEEGSGSEEEEEEEEGGGGGSDE